MAQFGPLASGYSMTGDGMTLHVDCLSVTSPADSFVTNETWVVTNMSATNSWVEAGQAYGYPKGANQYLYVAQGTPSGTYTEVDDANGSSANSTTHPEAIIYTGPSQWSATIGSWSRTFTGNAGPTNEIQAGTETNTTNSANTHASGYATEMGFYNSSGTFTYNWSYSHGSMSAVLIPSSYGFSHIGTDLQSIHVGTVC